ncbi:Conserved hypothetical protein [Shewanella piezotolerans WP3]|uniref:Flagellin n=1 Tax=Shewanella piezotolerans (strain WP3 / JCM 13877) TaxID=225849 RepID=B8CVQ5_SHEPW|nr:hypothetical protein [Shewanella piezotolerans]ACJ31731.1 Conserved hypothetical protein [Shewanella piezotolerans WP3]
MLQGITDTLNIQQRSQSVAPAMGAQQVLKDQQASNVAAIPTHRLESYSKWAKVTQGQHKISASQVAEQGLQQVKALLKQLHNQAKQSLNMQQSTLQQSRAKQLQKQLAQLDIRYQDQPLVDHQLNLISATRPAAKHNFSLKSVDLSVEKQRDEYITIQLGSDSSRVLLPANETANSLVQHLSSALQPLDILVAVNKSGKFVFQGSKSQWQQAQAGLLMTGQGQRLPAGEARSIKVNEELNWQDPREWRFGSNEELKQAIAKIAKSLHKVELQLQELAESKQKIQQQLQRINSQKPTAADLDTTMNKLTSLMQPSPFNLQVTSLMAQANITRTQVSALLS